MTPSAGEALPTLVIARVDPQPMKVMALLLRDSNPIHLDPRALEHLGLEPRVINQGPISLGYVMTMLSTWLGNERRITGLRCRFLGNVRAGDKVVVGGSVRSVTTSDTGEGSAECEVWLDVAGSGRVMDGTATVTVPPSPADS